MAKNWPKHQGYSLGVFDFWSASRNQTKLHDLVLLGKANLVAILSCPDLLAGAENRPPLEWPKIGQNTLILECVSESNKIAPCSTIRKGESSGDN